jgi:hypothetical protein
LEETTMSIAERITGVCLVLMLPGLLTYLRRP